MCLPQGEQEARCWISPKSDAPSLMVKDLRLLCHVVVRISRISARLSAEMETVRERVFIW